MLNPLRRMSGSSLSGSNKNSSSSGKDSRCSDGKNEEEEEKQRGSPCSNNGGLKAGKKLSAAKYREILLKNQRRVEEDEKSGVKGKLGGNGRRSMEIEHNGGQCSEIKLMGVEIKAEDTVPVEPEEGGGKLNVKVCGGEGGIGEDCRKDVQTKAAAQMASDDNVCVICKLGGSTGTLLGCSGKGCKKNYHLKCVDLPLKDVPPSVWYCFSCVKKRFLPGAVEFNLDAVKVELADSEGLGTAKYSLCSKNGSNGSAEKLRKKPVRVVASDSKFVEYWVPAKLSYVQLEQYCDILLSNSILLRSCSKAETVEALRDVLTSTRKCCDHPYFVNPSLQKTLMNGLLEAEFLNVGIKASGKLQVLDTILSETKKQGLRVLIIFQSTVGSSGISLGDVLDDVVRQRCGEDSYERVDCGLIMPDPQFSKIRQAAMNRFNDKDKGRIVFLLDRRACHSSIKLSSVDIVILYDSDLNPYNDLKLLQKITINSQHKQLKLFRLYSFCTLEEMVLIHAKQGVSIDAQNLNHSTIHQLLRWGASYLFKELSEFHGSSSSSGSSFSSKHLMAELFALPPQDAGKPSTSNSSVVVKVNQTGGTYSRDISLPGELEMQSGYGDPSHAFWTKLLNRKTPRWRYLPAASSPQRIRKRVQYFQGSLENENFESDDVMKKRRKVLTDTIAAGESETPVVDCSQFLPAVPVGASRYRKANKISNVPAASMGESVKISVQQELEVEVGESHHSCLPVLPPPSEPPCPKSVVESQVGLVNSSASRSASQPDIQLDNDSQSEPPRPEPPVKDPVELVSNPALRSASQPDIQLDNGHITSQQAECPRQQPVTKEHAELPSEEVIAVEAILHLPIMSIDTSVGGRGKSVSDSRSMGGVPGSINHSRESAPMTSSQISQSLLRHDSSSNEHVSINNDKQLDNGIHLGHNISRQAEFPTQPATTEVHSAVPSYNNSLQDTMLQQPVVVNRRVRGSVTRVSDFRSLGVVPDRKIHPWQIAPLTPQTLPQDDPFEFELAILCKEREEVLKLHEELKIRMKSDYDNELQAANRKYRKLHHNNDTALAQTRKAVHTNRSIFLMNALLAECFRSKML
ncbi:uncharacterized protein LOC113330141 isoform X2 [Papaver somniferum]|uniref:uncharacterized protein LOC113330141 isoform X2 n=1 Tax=Papaver somniferum TaxID=3469 RepID=UPI000E6FD9D3|nr:uncharacterized protein LOC113330141 isoform X2 [Papaver somniferum]